MAYAGLLQDMLREADLPVHLVVHDLGRGAGDPLARVQLAVQRLVGLRRTRIAPIERFILIDDDQVARDPARAERARDLAGQHDIEIVWQVPCFEALLLRHLPDCTTRRPPDTAKAVRALAREWPGYRKPLSRAMLAERIDRSALHRAAGVEPALRALLRCLGLGDY